MFVISEVRKAVSFQYQPEGVEGDENSTILGDHIEITARNPATGEDFEPKKTVPNDASFALAFPEGYTGMCEIAIHGSEGGDQTDTVEILP